MSAYKKIKDNEPKIVEYLNAMRQAVSNNSEDFHDLSARLLRYLPIPFGVELAIEQVYDGLKVFENYDSATSVRNLLDYHLRFYRMSNADDSVRKSDRDSNGLNMFFNAISYYLKALDVSQPEGVRLQAIERSIERTIYARYSEYVWRNYDSDLMRENWDMPEFIAYRRSIIVPLATKIEAEIQKALTSDD